MKIVGVGSSDEELADGTGEDDTELVEALDAKDCSVSFVFSSPAIVVAYFGGPTLSEPCETSIRDI